MGGSLATEMAVCPSGDSSRMCRATKAICWRSCGSNFWLPRVDIRRCGPVFVVALEFGLDTKPAPWLARVGAWPIKTLHCFRLAFVMITTRFCCHSRTRTGVEPLAPAFSTVHWWSSTCSKYSFLRCPLSEVHSKQSGSTIVRPDRVRDFSDTRAQPQHLQSWAKDVARCDGGYGSS